MTYKESIVVALDFLKDRTGSSLAAIKKQMQGSMPKDKKWLNATFLTALKSMVSAGDLIQIKSSYKLSPEFKKARLEASKPKKVALKKKATAPKKSTSAKKSAPKRKKTAASNKSVPKKKKTTASKKSAPKKKKTATTKKSAPKKKKTTSTKKATVKKAASKK